MIAVDTNVVVRLLVRDDEEQYLQVVALLERARASGQRCLLGLPVLCETVWVLGRSYGVPRGAIAGALANLLEDPAFEIDLRELANEALERYRTRRGDFADYIVTAVARRRGAATTHTFDAGLRRDPDFTLLGASLR